MAAAKVNDSFPADLKQKKVEALRDPNLMNVNNVAQFGKQLVDTLNLSLSVKKKSQNRVGSEQNKQDQ